MECVIENYLDIGKSVILKESLALNNLAHKLDHNFTQACDTLLNCQGKVVVSGIGKSGHIARKIAATMASTGTSSFFLHPAEACHGDLGIIDKKDVVILISYSGNSDEILFLIPSLKKLNVPIITITGNTSSLIAQKSDIVLNINIKEEACHLKLAPTTSTTVTLALGDALAVSIAQAKNFQETDFAFSHPGGSLGRSLVLKISDIMLNDHYIPSIDENISLKEALIMITKKSLGILIITDKNQNILGVFTDGDIRRCINNNIDFNKTKIAEIMNAEFITANQDQPAKDAINLIKKYKINALPIVNNDNKLCGILNLHTLMQAKII